MQITQTILLDFFHVLICSFFKVFFWVGGGIFFIFLIFSFFLFFDCFCSFLDLFLFFIFERFLFCSFFDFL